MKTKQGHEKVHLIGESAGGNLVTVVAALVCNPKALAEFAKRCQQLYGFQENVEEWQYPQISSVSSWYGILDTKAWKNARWLWFGLNWVYDAHRDFTPMPSIMKRGQEFKWQLHNSQLSIEQKHRRIERHTDPFMTLMCMLDRIIEYPPCFLAAGSSDPLGLEYSSTAAYEALQEKFPNRHENKKLMLEIKNAGHAYCGLPPMVLYFLHGPNWRQNGQATTFNTIDFIDANR